MSDGSLAVFATRPITVVMLILGLISLFLPFIISAIKGGKK
jgi:TctA family transporter